MANLAAHITGTVVKIEKRPGDAVRPGEPVVILESMKMEMPLEAATAGRVKEIRCAEGQPVSEGDVLAVIE
jgi:acetyl-CoA carboxylase biotin carboxyl carrier protein